MSDLKTHWSGFITALNKNAKPECTNSINTSSQKGVSGFLDLKPVNTSSQAKYDAMSATWEGVEASDKATLKQKSDKTEFMPYQK